MAQSLAVSTVAERPGSRGFMCRRRRCELKSSMRFSRMVAAVKYVRVTDNEMSGPLCTQCGVPGDMYTARPGVMEFGEETKTNATRLYILPRLLPCVAMIPDSSWSR